MFIYFFKKFKLKTLLSFFFLILVISACTLWQIKINENRVISWEPDDHLHFINKASSFKYCQDNTECNHKNLISKDVNYILVKSKST